MKKYAKFSVLISDNFIIKERQKIYTFSAVDFYLFGGHKYISLRFKI